MWSACTSGWWLRTSGVVLDVMANIIDYLIHQSLKIVTGWCGELQSWGKPLYATGHWAQGHKNMSVVIWGKTKMQLAQKSEQKVGLRRYYNLLIWVHAKHSSDQWISCEMSVWGRGSLYFRQLMVGNLNEKVTFSFCSVSLGGWRWKHISFGHLEWNEHRKCLQKLGETAFICPYEYWSVLLVP